MRSDEDPDDFFYKKDRCFDCFKSVTPKESPSDRQYEDIICSVFHQSTTESTRPTLKGRTATLQTFGGLCRRSTPTTSPAPTPTRQDVSQDAASQYRQRGGTSAIQNAPSTTIRMTVPSARQSVSINSDADNGSIGSEVEISRISRSRGASSSRGREEGKSGAHAIRPPPTAMQIATPGRQTGLTQRPLRPSQSSECS